MLQGSFAVFPVETLVCVACSGLTAVYFVVLLSRTCFGRLDNTTAYYPLVRWSERAPGLVLTLLILALGVQPGWLTRWSEATTGRLAQSQVIGALLPSPIAPTH